MFVDKHFERFTYLNRNPINADCYFNFFRFDIGARFGFFHLLWELQASNRIFNRFYPLRLINWRAAQKLKIIKNQFNWISSKDLYFIFSDDSDGRNIRFLFNWPHWIDSQTHEETIFALSRLNAHTNTLENSLSEIHLNSHRILSSATNFLSFTKRPFPFNEPNARSCFRFWAWGCHF